MPLDDEKRAIGRQIKRYLAVHRISREQFCFETKLGKSTVDKLITGIFSENTIQTVYERTNFVRSSHTSAADLGGYSKSMWINYISDYLFIRPKLENAKWIKSAVVSIKWDDQRPGLILYERGKKGELPLGEISIPYEKSTLIYVQPIGAVKAGASLILSIMVRTPVMRGLMLGVDNIAAYAWVPAAAPVVLKRIGATPLSSDELGDINPKHPKYNEYKKAIDEVMEKRFARMVSL